MPLPPPPWSQPEEVQQYCSSFLWCFTSRAHFDSYLKTGELAQPATLRNRARLAADPKAAQRDKLRKAVSSAKACLKRAQVRLTAATAAPEVTPSWGMWPTPVDLARIEESIATNTRTLASAEMDLALFDLQHYSKD
jgi:hypothetical protein